MNLCVRCKGRDFCKRGHCTILEKMNIQKKANTHFKQEFQGTAPNVFVGKFGYPHVSVGLLATEYSGNDVDDPLQWSAKGYSINKVMDLRSNLIHSKFASHIQAPVLTMYKNKTQEKLTEISKEISLSKTSVDTEVSLHAKPLFKLSFNQDSSPHGPSVAVKTASITENVRVPTKVDKVVSAKDLSANEALSYLYKHQFDEHYLTKILSVGNLGIGSKRKLVPTRWAITAVDDSLGKQLLSDVKGYSRSTGYEAYFGGHLGNYYLVLFFPGVWSYELFETYLPGALWNQEKGATIQTSTDFETFAGRKEYAHETTGGYYATRLAILEYLHAKKRQGTTLVFRFITDEYYAPLGVWVVREATRKTLLQKPLEFSSRELLLTYAKHFLRKKFGIQIDSFLERSHVVSEQKHQKKLFEF